MENDESRPAEWAAKIDDLARRAETLPDARAKAVAIELLQVVMQYHAAALERMLAIVGESPGGETVIRSLVEDHLAASILLLHDLHPDSFEVRVADAIHRLRLQLNPRGANVALLGTDGGVVRLRCEIPRNRSIPSLKNQIEDTIAAMAPEAAEVIIEGLEEQPPRDGFVPIEKLFAGQTT